jgi:hypothetical protein
MITSEKLSPSGGWKLTALVETKPYLGRTERFFHSQRYFGYAKRDAVVMFRQSISDKGWRLA